MCVEGGVYPPVSWTPKCDRRLRWSPAARKRRWRRELDMKRTRKKQSAALEAKVAATAVRGSGRSPSWREGSGPPEPDLQLGKAGAGRVRRASSSAAAHRRKEGRQRGSGRSSVPADRSVEDRKR